ncbi:glycosyltransferase family 2 protein [Novosphingobium huizhouense]|uniref:glycosyltransferase family 2 protein n=1 Tax=Novosphingobium huizhouense TaxID=2866625 RepID=UPI001CD8AE66|nr:glycosyltransferase family 2 protein [Novosphingobium huizhouense]
MPPRASVIVPHYNDLDGLDRCLAALSRQTLPRDDYEIVVADNDSPVPAAELKRVIADRARLVTAYERGAGPARNTGVQASEAPLLAFTDADCIPEPDWLEAGLRGLDRLDVVGGRVRVATTPGRELTGAEGFELVFAFDNRAYVETKGFTVTANMFCRRATFDTVGAFRNGVPEDADWGHRAVRHGFSIGYVAEACVWHPARADWTQLQRKWERLNREAYAATEGRKWRLLNWRLRALALPASVLFHAPRVLGHDALPDWRARMVTLAALARIRLWRMKHALQLASDGAVA